MRRLWKKMKEKNTEKDKYVKFNINWEKSKFSKDN